MTRPGVDLGHIERGDLTDPQRLGALYLEAVRRGFWDVGEKAVLDFLALAMKALADDSLGTPGRLFHALLKAGDTDRVTNDHEDQARRAFPADARHDLLAEARRRASARVPAPDQRDAAAVREADEALLGRDIGFTHGILMQCFLPQRQLPAGQRLWSANHGLARLDVVAGTLPASAGRPARDCAVPSGSMARLILPTITRHALMKRTREVPLGRTVHDYVRNFVGVTYTAHNARTLARETENVATASFRFALGQEGRVEQSFALLAVADRLSWWGQGLGADDGPVEVGVRLSERFYEAVSEHPVPVDLAHLRKLTRSPRRMDLYSWLSYRLPRVPKGRPLPIRLSALHPIFAPDVAGLRMFKHRLASDLTAIARVHSGFDVEIAGDRLQLRHSPPPVPMRPASVLIDAPGPAAGRDA